MGALAKSTWVSWVGRWFLWFLATTVGLALAVVVAAAAKSAVAKVLGVPEAHFGMVLPFLAVFGAGLGASQWFVLRRWVRGAEWWVLATAAVWALAFAVEFPIGMFQVGAITGVAMMLLLAQESRR